MTLDLWGSLVALVAFGVAGVVAAYSWRKLHELSLAMLVWVLLAWLLAQNGFFAERNQLYPQDIAGLTALALFVMLPLVLLAAAWWFAKPLRDFADGVPLYLLIGAQVYRIFGVIFLWMANNGLLPYAVALPIGFGDVLVGALALPLALAFTHDGMKARRAAIAWNVLGITSITVGMGLMVLAFFGVLPMQPAPAMLGHYPLALLVLFQMPFALALHTLALRALLSR